MVVPVLTWATGGDLRVPFFSEVTVPELDAAGIRYDGPTTSSTSPTRRRGSGCCTSSPVWASPPWSLGCAALLVPVVRDLGRGDPFAPANVLRLRAVGLLLLVAWPVLTLAQVDGLV